MKSPPISNSNAVRCFLSLFDTLTLSNDRREKFRFSETCHEKNEKTHRKWITPQTHIIFTPSNVCVKKIQISCREEIGKYTNRSCRFKTQRPLFFRQMEETAHEAGLELSKRRVDGSDEGQWKDLRVKDQTLWAKNRAGKMVKRCCRFVVPRSVSRKRYFTIRTEISTCLEKSSKTWKRNDGVSKW